MSFNKVPDDLKGKLLEVCETHGGEERSSEIMTLGVFCSRYIVSEPDFRNILDDFKALERVLALNADHDRVNEHGDGAPFERFMMGEIDLENNEDDVDFVWSDSYGEGFMLNIYSLGI